VGWRTAFDGRRLRRWVAVCRASRKDVVVGMVETVVPSGSSGNSDEGIGWGNTGGGR
jgi:hypothetical protein